MRCMSPAKKTALDYKAILKTLQLKIAVERHGETKVRWALNRWLKSEATKKRLLKRQDEIKQELEEIEKVIG